MQLQCRIRHAIRSHSSSTQAFDADSSLPVQAMALSTSLSVAAINSQNTEVENSAPEIKEPAAQEFPTATEDQHKQARRAFIESIDSDAVCALASRVHNGNPCHVVNRDSGSFNVCFFVAFGRGGPEWVVRIPIEPALDDPWDKLQSEVSTLR